MIARLSLLLLVKDNTPPPSHSWYVVITRWWAFWLMLAPLRRMGSSSAGMIGYWSIHTNSNLKLNCIFSKVVKSFRNDKHTPLKQGKTHRNISIRICVWLSLRCQKISEQSLRSGYKSLSSQWLQKQASNILRPTGKYLANIRPTLWNITIISQGCWAQSQALFWPGLPTLWCRDLPNSPFLWPLGVSWPENNQ